LQSKPARKPITYTPAFDFVPDVGTVRAMTGDLSWFRLALPFNLNHVNIWLMQGASGWTIVDTGFNEPDTRASWDAVLSDKNIEQIYITHFHPDHFGLAGWLVEKTGVQIQMPAGEFAIVQQLMDADALKTTYLPYYIDAGISGDMLEQMMEKRVTYKKVVYKPHADYTPVKRGDMLALGGKQWQVVHGAGHTPDHGCLYNAADKVFIAGDIVLPDITPNISYFPGSVDPVAEFLHSIAAIKTVVPDDVLVLPSHGVPFYGLHKRIDEMAAHHEERAEQIRALCTTPKNAVDIMRDLFSHRELGIHDLFFALGETMAHLVYDVNRQAIEKTVKKGVSFYKTI
jgi:glyoxylase-like metal-dependent hydrolase (beta-lactamase superfamily II)